MRWFASSATRINVDAAVRKNHGHGGVIILRHHLCYFLYLFLYILLMFDSLETRLIRCHGNLQATGQILVTTLPSQHISQLD